MIRRFPGLMKIVSMIASLSILGGCSDRVESAPPSASVASRPVDASPVYDWTWRPEDADLAQCVARAFTDRKAEISPIPKDRSGALTLLVACAGGRELRILTHPKTPLVRRGDLILVASYSQTSSGCAIDAYDLSTATKLWSKELVGLGPIDHSKYRNLVTLEIAGDALVVRSVESAGRYIEAVRLTDGGAVFHRVLPRE